MKLKFTNLILALILSVGIVSAQFTTDGFYTIENVANTKFMDNPGSLGGIIKMTAGTATDYQWIIKVNGSGYNIISTDGQFLASSDGSKGLLIENSETNRNSATSGALISFTEQGNASENPYRFESEPGGVLKAWNGRRGSFTQVGMGTSVNGDYEWNLTRIGDLPSGDITPPALTITSDLIIDKGDDITFTSDENAKIYLVADGSYADLAEVVAAAGSNKIETFVTSGTFSTTALAYGDYILYAVDEADNLTTSGGVVSLVDVTVPQVVSWTFDTDGDTEGWVAGNTASGDVANGALTYTWGDDNSPKWTKSGFRVSTDDYKKVLVRMKNPNAAGEARVVTTTNGSSGTKFFGFTQDNSNTEFKTYIIDVSADPTKFNGTATSIQFQGILNKEAPGGSLSVSEIRLIRAENTWTGTASTDWNEAGNWANNVVPTGEEVVVPMVTNQPTISSGMAEVATLDLADGVVVSIASGATLRVLSDLTVTGNGHVEVASGGSLVTYGAVAGTDHVINRSTTFDANTGQYSVVGSPVVGASTSVLGSLVYSYDESLSYTSNRFMEVTTPETMMAGNAYFSAYTGEVTFTGTPNTGNVAVTLAYDAGDGSDAGFNLVSNPYPAAIDFTKLINGTTNPDIDGTIYLWDDGGSNAGQRTNADYITVNSIGTVSGGSGGSGDWNGYIGSGQGFFVKASTTGTLNFTNDMKAVGNNMSSNFFRTTEEEASIPSFKLSLSNAEGLFNQSLIGFPVDGTVGFDRLYDAYKMDGLNGLRLYSFIQDEPMAIQGLPLKEEMAIPLGIDVATAGEFTISLDQVMHLSEGMYVFLEDTQTGKMINLTEKGSYTFSSAISTNDKRFNVLLSNRRILSLESSKVLGMNVQYNINGVSFSNLGKEAKNAHVIITDLTGASLLSKQLENFSNTAEIAFKFDFNKIYFIKIITERDSFASKILFK